MEAKLDNANVDLKDKTEKRDAAKAVVSSVGRVNRKVTSNTLAAFFLIAYKKKLARMTAQMLLGEYRDKIEKYPGLMSEWANWMAIDYAGMYYHQANTTWHDPKSLLHALAEQNAVLLDQQIAEIDKGKGKGKDLAPELSARRAKLDVQREMIRAKQAPRVLTEQSKTGIAATQLTASLTRAQINGIDEQQRLGLLNHYWREGLIPVDAWRYIVAKTRLRLNEEVIADLMAADTSLREQVESEEGSDGELLHLYFSRLIESTRNSTAYIATIEAPYWKALLSQWRADNFNAWRRRGWAEVKEKGAHRTTVLQKNAVCNETAETAQMRRGQILPGGLWRNVEFYVKQNRFKRLTDSELLIPGASLFNLAWLEKLKNGSTNGARYHKSIPYVTEGGRVIAPNGPVSGRVIGDWEYHSLEGSHSIARRIPLEGPRPLMSGGRDPKEPHAEGYKAGHIQYLQWKHQATVTHSPWALGNRNVVMTWETRHGGETPEHLGFRARKLGDIVGNWKFWIGWTADDERAAAQTTAAHESALSDAAAAGLPDVEPGLLSGSAELGEE